MSVKTCALPDHALLQKYRQSGSYTDCYCLDVTAPVAFENYVQAFYTTWLFKLERFILKWAISKPSTDAQAAALAHAEIEAFAAWTVEDRAPDQLLMGDVYGRTRSWLMVAPLGSGSRLYFGSAVVPRPDQDGKPKMGSGFSALLGFHRLYSRCLLRVARARLLRGMVGP